MNVFSTQYYSNLHLHFVGIWIGRAGGMRNDYQVRWFTLHLFFYVIVLLLQMLNMNDPTGFMVTGSKDMCIKKWTLSNDLLENSKVAVASSVALSSSHTEKAHEKDINSMCVSVNGKLIATGSQDKTAKVRPNIY